MTDFFHGVETRRIDNSPVPVNVVATAIIGLVCTAPVHLLDADNQSVNTPRLITSLRNVAEFCGPDAPGFTGPQAFRGIYAQAAQIVIMVNVFDPASHKQSVNAEAVTLDGDAMQLANAQVISAVVKNQTGDTTYVAGTDYTLDKATGTITRLTSGAIAANSTLAVDYDYADMSLITSSDIIGGVDANGKRTGLQALKDVEALYGFTPKIIIAPGYCTLPTVATAMVASAESFDAEAFIDAPLGTSFQAALTGRGPAGTINFNISSDNAVLTWPHVRVDDGKGGTMLEGMSARLAGVRARVDREEGYHVSISNQVLPGVVGLEVPVYANRRDPNSEANLLNAAGILTALNAHGTGFRTFGNRSSSFPNSSAATTFEAINRTFAIIDESIERIASDFQDKPITAALIDALVVSVNAFLDRQIARGSLLPGSVAFFEASNNPATELANGHLTINRRYMAPTPAERITHEAQIDIRLYDNVAAQVAS